MELLELARKYEPYIISVRRYLHENPEESGKEYKTIEYISQELTRMGIDHTVIDEGGILAKITGKTDNGKAVLLRADVDGLPMMEEPYALEGHPRNCVSKNPGVMHACGHDGHTAMLLGAAQMLLEKRHEIEGTVYLCFERGEEMMGNVKNIFAWMDRQKIHVDTAFGMHLLATEPAGQMIINDLVMMAANVSFFVALEGKGGHGSRPDQANNPIDCFVAIYQRLESLRLTKIDPFKTCVYSIGQLEAGAQGNIIPQTLSFRGTMRTFDLENAGMKFVEQLKKTVDGMAEVYDCKASYRINTSANGPVVNDPQLAVFARNVIGREIGPEHVGTGEPWMASESFSRYLTRWPGVLAFLGIQNPDKGVGAAHHNPFFDIDEDVLKTGAAAAATYSLEYLKTPGLPGGRKA